MSNSIRMITNVDSVKNIAIKLTIIPTRRCYEADILNLNEI